MKERSSDEIVTSHRGFTIRAFRYDDDPSLFNATYAGYGHPPEDAYAEAETPQEAVSIAKRCVDTLLGDE